MPKPKSSKNSKRAQSAKPVGTSLLGALEQFAEKVLESRAEHVPKFDIAQRLWKAGISGIGFGLKETSGNLTPTLGVRVYVRAKLSKRNLSREVAVPSTLLGCIPTDVIEAGLIGPFAPKRKPSVKNRRSRSRGGDVGNARSPEHGGDVGGGKGSGRGGDVGNGKGPGRGGDVGDGTGPWRVGDVNEGRGPFLNSDWLPKDICMLRSPVRPLASGLSVGPGELEMAGTLGCLVRHTKTGKICVLSNNHVLAGSRLSGLPKPVRDKADIYQPGLLDRSDRYINPLLTYGHHEGIPIAKLSTVVDLHPSDPRAESGYKIDNRVDAALAELLDQQLPGQAPNGIFSFQQERDSTSFVPLQSPATPFNRNDLLFMTVSKVGRTTGLTMGTIVDFNTNIWVPYGELEDHSRYVWMVNQLAIVPLGSYPQFSAPGDSGSAIFDARTASLVGLLFAGGAGYTFANPVDAVFAALPVELL